jgi:hypothetical protein
MTFLQDNNDPRQRQKAIRFPQTALRIRQCKLVCLKDLTTRPSRHK